MSMYLEVTRDPDIRIGMTVELNIGGNISWWVVIGYRHHESTTEIWLLREEAR